MKPGIGFLDSQRPVGAGQVTSLPLTIFAIGYVIGQQGQMALSGGKQGYCLLYYCTVWRFSKTATSLLFIFFATAVS